MILSTFTFLLFAIGYLLFGLLLGGGILRIAIQLHNRFAVAMRYDRVINEPSLGSAVGLVLAFNLILLILSAIMQIGLQASGASMIWDARIVASVCLVCLSVVVMTWLLTVALEAHWKRALVVSCIYWSIILTIVATIFGTIAFVAIYD